MRIVDLHPDDTRAVSEVAALLIQAFPEAWPDIDAATREVESSFEKDRLSRVALDEGGSVKGWIGGIRQYSGQVWELHPLVVKEMDRGCGIGRALVTDLEACVRERGGITLWLGTDDDRDQTTLSGVDVYPNVFEHIAAIRNLRGHPYQFYQKLGYVIIGLMPDANGYGRPDIFMAKRVGGRFKADQ